ncbi:MAG: hypothetical protein H7Z37_07345 [Pyrinomonadaceae bacterium]|nr:hypothetical protein [Pyrinomonadaceae bacterium]
MNVVNELSSELAMAIFDQIQNGEHIDRQQALLMIQNVHNVLLPLSKKNEEAKMRKLKIRKPEERKSASH